MRTAASRCAAKVQALGAGLADIDLLTGSEIEAVANIAAIDRLPASFQSRGHARRLALRLALALSFSGRLALAFTFRWQMACLAKGLLLLFPILPNTSGRLVCMMCPG